MNYRLVIAPLAQAQIDTLYDYLLVNSIRLDTPGLVIDEIYKKIEELADSPKIGSIIDDAPRYRKRVAGHSLIYYRVDDKSCTVYILAVVDGRRNQSDILKSL